MKWLQTVYRFTVAENDSRIILTGLRPRQRLVMTGKHGKVWATLNTRGRLTIEGGYSWDGATPHIKVWRWVFGVWMGRMIDDWEPPTKTQRIADVPQLYIPTLTHDVLYQFKDELAGVGLTLKHVDDEFLRQCQSVDFIAAQPYYWMVRLYSRIRYRRFQELDNKDN